MGYVFSYAPNLNPLRFFYVGDGDFFYNRISEFEEKECYIQKFSTTDTLNFQVAFLAYMADFNNLTYSIYNINGDVIFQKALKIYNPGKHTDTISLWQVATNDSNILTNLESGTYYIVINLKWQGTLKIAYCSELFEITDNIKNTMLIEYANSVNDLDMMFVPEPDIFLSYQLRVEGGIWSDGYKPASKDVIYTDQKYNTVMLQSIPFYTVKYTFGDGHGIPNWLINKLNMILSLHDVRINGKKVTKAEGAKFERQGINNYAYAAWEIDLIYKEWSNSTIAEIGESTQGGEFNDDYSNDFLI